MVLATGFKLLIHNHTKGSDMRLLIVLCALFSLNLCAEEQFPAWELPNTQVHQLPAQNTGRHYEVWVELPPSYGKTEKKFPVLLCLMLIMPSADP